MLKRFICSVAQDIILHVGSVYLTVCCRQGYDLVSGRLYCTCLVCLDMRGFGRHDALMRTQRSRNDRKICLSSADEEMYIRVERIALELYLFARRAAIRVSAVACGLLIVCFNKAAHYLRHRAFKIVAFKPYHSPTSTITPLSSAETEICPAFSPRQSIIFCAIASSTSFWIVRRRLRAP